MVAKLSWTILGKSPDANPEKRAGKAAAIRAAPHRASRSRSARGGLRGSCVARWPLPSSMAARAPRARRARRGWRCGGICRAGTGAPLPQVEGQRQARRARSHGSAPPDPRLGQRAGIRCGWQMICSTRGPARRAPLPGRRSTHAADRGAAKDDPTGELRGRGESRGQHRGAGPAGPAGPWRTRSVRKPSDAFTMPGKADRLAQRAGSGGAAQAGYCFKPRPSAAARETPRPTAPGAAPARSGWWPPPRSARPAPRSAASPGPVASRPD